MLPPFTFDLFVLAVSCGVGCATAVYMAARRNEKHIEYALIQVPVPMGEYQEPGNDNMEQLDGQLDLIDALEQRNAVLDDMADRHSGWLALAAAEMRKIPAGEIGLAEDFRHMLLERGVPEPKSPNVWGPFTAYLVKQGMLVPTGQWKPMRSAKSNGRVSREYVRVESNVKAA